MEWLTHLPETRCPYPVADRVVDIVKVEDLGSGQLDLDDINYIDLAGFWDINENTTVSLGMTNVFDEEPPIAGNAAGPSIGGNGNVFPGYYDALGRYWFARASVNF